MPSVAAIAKCAAKLFSPCKRRVLAPREKPGQEEIGVEVEVELTSASEESSSVCGLPPETDSTDSV